MSKDIKEIIQEDIDEICTFGHYSVATAYNTLISARDKIKELQKEVERLEDNEVILADEVIRLEQENTKLKERVKELEEGCKKALERHQGGHSELGMYLRKLLTK